MRISLKKLKQIEKWYGSDNFEIGAGGDIMDGRGDHKYLDEYITLRFGYWSEIDNKELSKVIGKTVELDMEVEDDECGWQYSYKLI
jgi:hypothetical protein